MLCVLTFSETNNEWLASVVSSGGFNLCLFCNGASVKDRTAQTEPLTPGQKLVADWEMNPANEPADLAEIIDAALQKYWSAGHREGWRARGIADVKALTNERDDYINDSLNKGWHMTNNALRIVRAIKYEPELIDLDECFK